MYLQDDADLTYLHQLVDDKVLPSTIPQRFFLDWDASPFLYTIAGTNSGSCLLFDIRVRNESFKELFTVGKNHPYLSVTESLHSYQKSVVNLYQHVFLTDYSVIVVDSRMANRPVQCGWSLLVVKSSNCFFCFKAIHSRHELLRAPQCFTQTKWNNQHCIFVNDEYNTNVVQYSSDMHRRSIQVCPCWELCPISNSRIYLTNNDTHQDKEVLLAKSIYFDVPIRDMAIPGTSTNRESFLLYQVDSHFLICRLFTKVVLFSG